MRPRVFSGYVAFSLSKAERDRLTRVAQRCGYALLDPLAADLFRIGLSQLETTYVTTTHQERFMSARARMAAMNRAALKDRHDLAPRAKVRRQL